jgi:type II secretory pathway component PulF
MLGDTASHQVAKLSLLNLARTVRTGKLVSETLCAWPVLYPELFTSMLSVGERTGSLPQTLLYLGSFYEQEVEDMTKNISVLVEPVLMIVMGLLVGFIAVSIITPIYGLTEHLHA